MKSGVSRLGLPVLAEFLIVSLSHHLLLYESFIFLRLGFQASLLGQVIIANPINLSDSKSGSQLTGCPSLFLYSHKHLMEHSTFTPTGCFRATGRVFLIASCMPLKSHGAETQS